MSFGGRIELIRTVISAIALYWLQAIIIPIVTIHKIERMCANFLWKGGIHAISWEELCRPKKERGVGLRALTVLRKKASYKLFWRFLFVKSLWADWVGGDTFLRVIYGLSRSTTTFR